MAEGNVTNNYYFYDNSQKIDHIETYYDYGGRGQGCFDDLEEADFETIDEEKAEYVVEVGSPLSHKGRPKEYLFEDANGNKNEEVTAKQAQIVVAFLKKHNKYTVEIDTGVNSYTNQYIVAFYRQWEKEKLVPQRSPKGSALTRFLVEDCGMRMGVGVKTYSTFIGKVLNSEARLDYLVESNVQEFIKSMEDNYA